VLTKSHSIDFRQCQVATKIDGLFKWGEPHELCRRLAVWSKAPKSFRRFFLYLSVALILAGVCSAPAMAQGLNGTLRER